MDKIIVDIQPGFYQTPTGCWVYYIYVDGGIKLDPKYFPEIKDAIEKIVNDKP